MKNEKTDAQGGAVMMLLLTALIATVMFFGASMLFDSHHRHRVEYWWQHSRDLTCFPLDPDTRIYLPGERERWNN